MHAVLIWFILGINNFLILMIENIIYNNHYNIIL